MEYLENKAIYVFSVTLFILRFFINSGVCVYQKLPDQYRSSLALALTYTAWAIIFNEGTKTANRQQMKSD